jgi:outer membrane lipoprotein-sorting protein
MNSKLPLLAAPLLGLLLSGLACAQEGELTGEKILRTVEKTHRSKDEVALVEVVLVDAENKRRKRSMRTLFKAGEDENDKTITEFLDPPDVKGTAVLTVEASDRADDQWIYLPALKKAKRIASANRTNRFAGTDFAFEDLRTESFTANTYTREPNQKLGKTPVFVVVATPKPKRVSGYSKRVLYVEQERFLVHKVEYYDKAGKLKKTLTNKSFKKVQGLWRTEIAAMSDHQRKTKTVMRFGKRKINKGLPKSRFTVVSLERGS